MDKVAVFLLTTGFIVNVIGVCLWLVGAMINVAIAAMDGWWK